MQIAPLVLPISGEPYINVVPGNAGKISDKIAAISSKGSRNAMFALVMSAIKVALLDKYVMALPNWIDTQVGGRGARISGGQRQQLGIARAIGKNLQ